MSSLAPEDRDGPLRIPRLAPLSRWLSPEWPLNVLFVGLPLWWLLGVIELVTTVASVVMAFALWQRRRIALPRGFGLWVLFLAWVCLSVLVVQIDAPGAVPGQSLTRYATWAYRLLWYLKATVLLLYIGNLLVDRPLERLTRAFGWVFVWTVAGGVLGVAFPYLSFPSLTEAVLAGFLPGRVVNTGFVNMLIHPRLAEIQQVLGTEMGRPSAPFPYANIWGLNFACTLPFFLHGWLGRPAGIRRWIAVPLLAVSTIPLVLSLNRALWMSLVFVGVMLALRAAVFGRLGPVLALLAAGALAAGVLVVTPLGQVIEARFTSPNSNEGRSNLFSLGLSAVNSTSPVLGFGTTRDVQGSFTSIAVGSTASCPRCTPPSLGTQGQVSLVNFTQGWGGTLFYFAFVGSLFLRAVRLRSAAGTVGLSVVAAHLVTSPVYSADNLALFPIMAALALLWRAELAERVARSDWRRWRARHPAGPSVASLAAFTRRHGLLIGVVTLGGGLLGLGWQIHHGTIYQARINVLLPAAPNYPGSGGPGMTLDTEAQLVGSDAVRQVLQKAAPRSFASGNDHLEVTVPANTRILTLTYRAAGREPVTRAVKMSAQAVIEQRAQQLAARRQAALNALKNDVAATDEALQTLRSAYVELQGNSRRSQLKVLNRQRFLLMARSEQASSALERVTTLPTVGGRVLTAPTVRPVWDGYFVRSGGGAAIGLVVGLALAWWKDVGAGRAQVPGRPTRRNRFGDDDPELWKMSR